MKFGLSLIGALSLSASAFQGVGNAPLQEIKSLPWNKLAGRPPMGWNSWNKFGKNIDDKTVREIADAMVRMGMKNAGYVYVNIDDTWEGERDASGRIHPNKKFPDMKALADFVHSKGLLIGIYSSPGPKTCEGFAGSYGHEQQDVDAYNEWGIDYLKYDWCSAGEVYKDAEMQAAFGKMGKILQASPRPIVYSISQGGRADVWTWGPKAGANLWRTTDDIEDNWNSMSAIGFKQLSLAAYAGPGHWNDPDMLEVGNGGMTDDEYRTHMSLWAMLAAPIIAGNDLRHMSDRTREMLTNKEVLGVDRDALGKEAKRVSQHGDLETWMRPLQKGNVAVALFNKGDQPAKMSVKWSEFPTAGKSHPIVRDLWKHEFVKVASDTENWTTMVPKHGSVMLVISRL